MGDKHTYTVVTSETTKRPNPWKWELYRDGKPLGVKVFREGYVSQTAADFAGQRALKEFLQLLAQEEKRKK